MRHLPGVAAIVCGTLLLLMPQVHRSIVAANVAFAGAVGGSGAAPPAVAGFLDPALDAASLAAGGCLLVGGLALGAMSVRGAEARRDSSRDPRALSASAAAQAEHTPSVTIAEPR